MGRKVGLTSEVIKKRKAEAEAAKKEAEEAKKAADEKTKAEAEAAKKAEGGGQ
jgi:penicillin-binding protein